MKSKFKLTLTILLSFILIINTSLYASTLPSNSQQDVQQYISNLTLLKNNMYTLAKKLYSLGMILLQLMMLLLAYILL